MSNKIDFFVSEIHKKIKEGSHAILLNGVINTGVLEIAENFTKQTSDKIVITLNKPKIKEIIDLKTVLNQKNADTQKFIIIEDISNTSIACQNSLLKIIEEPKKNLFFILISYNQLKNLETIESRCCAINCNVLLEEGNYPISGNNFNFLKPELVAFLKDHKSLNEAICKEVWPYKDLEKNDYIYLLEYICHNYNLDLQTFLNLQKQLKNILHTGSVKLNMYELATYF